MRKKVLIITPFYPPNIGGAETFAEELVRQMRKKSEVEVCTINWGRQKLWRGTNWAEGLKIGLSLACKVLFRRNRGESVSFCLGLNSAFVGLILKVFRKTPFKVILLTLYDFKNRPFLAWISGLILRRADVIFCESNVSREDLFYTGVKWRNTEIFTHWVDQEKFFPIEHDNPHLKVLFVGRPLWEKGKHIIQEVERQLWEVDFEYIENMRYEDLPRHYQMADILVVPSVYAESPNRVVAEGAACGCVVIVSNQGALPEQADGFGIITEPTADYFKYNIATLASDRKMLKAFREITIKYAQEYFTERNALTIMGEY